MKKFEVVEKVNGELQENVYYGENSKDVKALDGFVAITNVTNVQHPSPQVMQRVLLEEFLNNNGISLEKFYEHCETVKAMLEEEK